MNDARMFGGFALGVILLVVSLFLVWFAVVAATGNENVFSVRGTNGRSHPTPAAFMVLLYLVPAGLMNSLRFAALRKVSD